VFAVHLCVCVYMVSEEKRITLASVYKARFTRHRISRSAESVFSPFSTVAIHFIYACSHETAADRIQ
jgi:hypothetical protein